ncbi:MAG TPA: hypothetical protein VHU92_07380 [Streptosporangiaceae bacterium]|nr:hypothetical protein [Streptosporangiaceae bacterium]
MSGLRARLAAVAATGILITTALASAASASVTPAADGSVSGLTSLNAIACATAKACVAAGLDQNGNARSAVINAVSGTARAWPGKLAGNDLNAITCPSATSCLAVADDAVVTVKVSTGAMRVTARPKPPASGIVAMGALACAGAKNCYAVGFQGSPVAGHALIVHLSAAGKLLSKTPVAGTGISAIACPSSSHCLISDHSGTAEQIKLLNNGRLAGSHTLPAHTYIQHIVCYQASLCYALGGSNSSAQVTTDELFPLNPKSGAIGHVVKLGKLNGTALACSSARKCLVVGFTGTGASAKPAVVVVSSGKPGKPAGEPGTYLNGVACATASACYAVGAKADEAIVDKV